MTIGYLKRMVDSWIENDKDLPIDCRLAEKFVKQFIKYIEEENNG